MFFKIRDDILFRQYDGHGYITDTSEFSYRSLNDTGLYPGETFVSESGSAMLAELSKSPRAIDDVVDSLMQVFEGVEREDLKTDTLEFFRFLVDQGYLSEGDSPESCFDLDRSDPSSSAGSDKDDAAIPMGGCSKGTISPNDFLRSVHFDIAGACNERCVHCYIPDEHKTQAIDSELFFQILEQARELNAIHVTLSGGEPLLHRDFIRFLKRCNELDLSVNVLSNLTLLTEDMVAEMRRNPLLSVQTSLYSMDPSVHDSITGRQSSFEKTVGSILQIRDAGIPMQISCPVMKQNKDSFRDVITWGKEHGIAVAVEPIIFASYDRSGSNLANRISLEELEDVLDKEMSEGYAEPLHEAAKDKERLTGNDPVCSVCRYSLCVSVEGDVFPCAGWQSNVIGSLRRNTLREIWESSEEVKQLRRIKRAEFPSCVGCANQGYCTVCMMANANENPDGDPFLVADFRCESAALTRRKVENYLRNAMGDTLGAASGRQ